METNNKLREALKDIGRLIEQIHFLYSDYPSEIHEIARKVNAALAEPVKNCEVGTVEQQAKRFEEYCESEVCKRKRCKSRAKALCIEHCALAWAQMPYEAEDMTAE